MEVDGPSAVEAVAQTFPRFPSTGSVNVPQRTRHRYSQSLAGTPSLPVIDLTGPDPLHLNSPLSPTTPLLLRFWANESVHHRHHHPLNPASNPGCNVLELNQVADRSLLKRTMKPPQRTMQATEEADGGRRYSLRKRDGDFHPYTDYLRMWGREGKKLLDNLDKMERKKKRARVDESVNDDEEEYHQETQEESQTQRPHLRRSRSESREPQRRSEGIEKGRSKGHQHHPRPPVSPLYRPRAWVPPSPPRNPTKPVQEPIRRPDPQHDLSNKPRRFIPDDGSPVRGRACGTVQSDNGAFPRGKGDTSDEGEPLARERPSQNRAFTQLVHKMGDADSSEPDYDFNQPMADSHDELGSLPYLDNVPSPT
jgi:hypothetical protein